MNIGLHNLIALWLVRQKTQINRKFIKFEMWTHEMATLKTGSPHHHH